MSDEQGKAEVKRYVPCATVQEKYYKTYAKPYMDESRLGGWVTFRAYQALEQQLSAERQARGEAERERDEALTQIGQMHLSLTMLRNDATDGNNWKTLINNAKDDLTRLSRENEQLRAERDRIASDAAGEIADREERLDAAMGVVELQHEALVNHSRWCGHYKNAPGDPSYRKAIDAYHALPTRAEGEKGEKEDANGNAILDYPAAARAIALWLDRFCDERLPYPNMVADAARKARARLDELEADTPTPPAPAGDESHQQALERLNLKPGDRVVVTRAAKDREAGWSETWVDHMDEAVGKAGVVKSVEGPSGIKIRFGDGLLCNAYFYPAHVLKRCDEPAGEGGEVPESAAPLVREYNREAGLYEYRRADGQATPTPPEGPFYDAEGNAYRLKYNKPRVPAEGERYLACSGFKEPGRTSSRLDLKDNWKFARAYGWKRWIVERIPTEPTQPQPTELERENERLRGERAMLQRECEFQRGRAKDHKAKAKAARKQLRRAKAGLERLRQIERAFDEANSDATHDHEDVKRELLDEPTQPGEPAPCPWCGGKETHIVAPPHDYSMAMVQCTSGHCTATGPSCDTPAEAIAAWNRVAGKGEPQGCPTPGACSCVAATQPAPSSELYEAAKRVVDNATCYSCESNSIYTIGPHSIIALEEALNNTTPSTEPDSIVARVIEKHRQRAAKGKEKYGTTMDRTDLFYADWLEHLQQELMDAAVYAERLKADHENGHGQAYLDGQNSVLSDVHQKLGLGEGKSWERITERIKALTATPTPTPAPERGAGHE